MTFDTTSPWGTWKPRGIASLCLRLIDALPPCTALRRLAFLLRKPVKNSAQEVFDREIWGLKLRLATRGNLSEQRWLTMPAFHDPIERQALQQALQGGGLFLDVGANAGFYSFWVVSLKIPNVKVIAVEPSPTMLTRLRYNLAANHLQDSVYLLPCAVNFQDDRESVPQTEGARHQGGISRSLRVGATADPRARKIRGKAFGRGDQIRLRPYTTLHRARRLQDLRLSPFVNKRSAVPPTRRPVEYFNS